jgi:hypothetical protein
MYTFKFKKLKGGTDKSGNRKYDTITIKNIVDIDPVGGFNKEDKEEETKKDDNDLSDKNIDKMAPEDITQLILSDPTFKAAFLKKPTFWDAILKRNPKGILAAKKILRNIGSSSSAKSDKDDKETEVTSLFKNNQEYILRLSDKSFIKDDVNIDIQKSYTVKAKKRTNTRGDITVFLYGNGFVVKVIKLNNKSNNEFSGEIIINFKKENEYRERRVFKITDAY